jgi:hypothetical protein
MASEGEMFDYHREMTDAVSQVSGAPDEFVWVMNEEHRRRYRYYLEHVMGLYPDDSESFGIGIMTGEPKNGLPFELVRRTWDGYD